MSKIIIHNEGGISDSMAIKRVSSVVAQGFISGENQYCWLTTFFDCEVLAMKTRGKTHTFKVRGSR